MSSEPGGGNGGIETPPTGEPLAADSTAYAPSVAENLASYQRAGGIITPVITAVFAFFMGGIVVLATGHNPWKVYKGIFSGSGLNWFFHFGNYSIGIPGTNHHVWFWWNTSIQSNAAYNLQQTLLLTTTLILTGLAVAFAFRCGLFNIGGQGQYLIGVITGLWVGTSLPHLARGPHVLLAIVVAIGLRGDLGGHRRLSESDDRSARGDHDDHAQLGRVLDRQLPVRTGRAAAELGEQVGAGVGQRRRFGEAARVLGERRLQGLHIGFFIAIAALVAFWFTLNRTTTGYEVRAVGFNPEAARYGGISVARNYVLAMAISGSFAGLAGCMDMLGYQYRLRRPRRPDVAARLHRHRGRAAREEQGDRRRLSALLFAALLYGTSTRSIDQSVLPAGARRQPHADDPGARVAVRRSGRARSSPSGRRGGRCRCRAG